MNKVKFLVLIISSFVLFSCSSMSDWIGDKPSEKKIDGERISVLYFGSTIKPDRSLGNVPVKIPRARTNKKWYKSSGHHSLIPENPAAPELFTSKKIRKIGKAISGQQHLSASPIIAKGMVYTIDSRGLITASNAHNIKEKIWRYKIELPKKKEILSSSGLSYWNNKIYVATGYNQILAINANNGRLIWKRKINSIARSAPAIGHNTVFVNTIDNKLYALDAEDGGIIWVHSGIAEEISILGSASPIVLNNLVVTAYSSGELYALSPQNGEEIWYETFASNSSLSYNLVDIEASPIAKGSNIYAVGNDGILAAIEINSGRKKWQKEVSGNKSFWIAGNFLYLLSTDDEIIAVHKETGGVKWITKLPSYKKAKNKSGQIYWTGPVMAGGNLLVVGSHGRMLSISPKNGKILLRNKVPDDIYIPPIVAYGTVFLLSDNAHLIALSGDLEATITTEDKRPPKPIRRKVKSKSFFDRIFGD